jgi:predicted MFS family arabinose efflux permease
MMMLSRYFSHHSIKSDPLTRVLISYPVSSCITGAFVGPSAGAHLLEHFGYRAASMYILVTEAVMIVFFIWARIRQAAREKKEKHEILGNRRRSSQTIHSVI